jgi:hypothetical protein
MELARKRKACLTAEFTRKRTISLLLGALFAVMAGIATAYAQPMLAFNAGVISLIFLVRAIDAHGMVHEVQRYSDKTLFVRMASSDHAAPTKPMTDLGS